MDSARESWALLVTGLLVNTLLVNQITKENIRKGIRLQSQKKTVDRDNDVGENNRNLQHNKSQNINLQSFSVSLMVPSLRASSPLRVESEASRERTRERASELRSPQLLALASPCEALAWLLATPWKELAQSLTLPSLNKQTHSLCFHLYSCSSYNDSYITGQEQDSYDPKLNLSKAVTVGTGTK